MNSITAINQTERKTLSTIDAEKAAAIAMRAANLAQNIHGISCEAIALQSSDSDRCAQLIETTGALAQQVGWLCDLIAETLGHRGFVTVGDAKDWMLPPAARATTNREGV